MIIDELIAKLGFKVEGLDALKRAVDRMKQFVRGVLDSINPLKKASDAVNPLKASLTATAAAASPASAAMARFGSIAGTVATGILGIVSASSVAAAGIAVLALAFARAGLNAARARREMQLTAAGKGTTINRSELLRNTLGAAAGVGEKKAQGYADELINGVREKLKEALAGDVEAKAALVKRGISARSGSGIPTDGTTAALQIASQIVDRNAQAERLRLAGRTKAANRADERNRSEAKDFGIGPELFEVLREFKSVNDLQRKIQEAGERAPGRTQLQEDRDKLLAKSFSELQQKLETIGEAIKAPFMELARLVSESLIGPLNSFADALISAGKRLGLINETKQEKEKREAGERQFEAEAPQRERKAQESQDRFNRDIENRAQRRREQRSGQQKPTPASTEENSAIIAPPSWLGDLGATMSGFISGLNNASVQDLQRDAQAKVENNFDHRKYEDIGTDKRQVSVTVNNQVQGLEGIGAAVKSAVGAALAKTANTSTAAVTAP